MAFPSQSTAMTDTIWAKQTIKLQEKPNLHLMLHVILITSPDDCGWSGGWGDTIDITASLQEK